MDHRGYRFAPAHTITLAAILLITSSSSTPTSRGESESRTLGTSIPSRRIEASFNSDDTPTVTSDPSVTIQPTPTSTSSITQTATSTPSNTPPETPTPSPSITNSPTPSPTASNTPTATLIPPPATTPFPPRSVMINELAWSGTLASANDEWIELLNTTNSPVNLNGWVLSDGGDINIQLQGTISPKGYFLLERTNNSTISDIGAQQIYRGSLRNSGETLRLRDPSGAQIDSANGNGGAWPAGEATSRRSMERVGGGDQDGNWGTFTGAGGAGHDAGGNPIRGTPGRKNSVLLPPPTSTPPPHPTPSPSATSSSDPTPIPFPIRSIWINEIAWAGTLASSSDEWIELYNPGNSTINLDGWVLTDSQDIEVHLTGGVPSKGFFLLERTDDSVIVDIEADQIYVGGLSNNGESLKLLDPTGAVIDTANSAGGGWLAGKADTRFSMEREGGPDIPGNWETYSGYYGNGHDTDGNLINGTPKKSNSILKPLPAPTWIPGSIRINEVLIKPHYDWEGKGGVNTGDEFIELINIGPGTVFLKGWYLDDAAGSGSRPYKIRGFTLKPGSMMAFFNTETHVTLNDSGDTVRLLDPSGNVVDEITYLRVSAYNLSYGRLPDGSGTLKYGLWPTPNEPNTLYEQPFIPETALPLLCPNMNQPVTFLMRHLRHPAQLRWMRDKGYMICG